MCSKSLAGLKNYRGWSPRLVTAAYLELPSIEAIVTAGRGGCGTQFWFIVIKSTNFKRSFFCENQSNMIILSECSEITN